MALSIATYAELQTAIANYLNRDDLTSIIPTFIANAEAQINRDVNHWRQETRTDISVSSQYYDLPADWRSAVRLSVSTAEGPVEIEQVSLSDITDMRTVSADTANTPRFYAIAGGSLEFYPTPSSTVTVSLVYRATIPALSDSNTSNWLLAHGPDVYLHGSLIDAYTYLHDDQRLQPTTALYTRAVQSLNADSKRAKFGGTGLRVRVNSY